MPEARSATRDDVAELVRLRGAMLAAMAGREPDDDGWRQDARRILLVDARRLAEAVTQAIPRVSRDSPTSLWTRRSSSWSTVWSS